MDQKKEILNQTVIEEEKPEVSLAEKLREQKKKAKKKKTKRIILLTFVLLISYALWFLLKPFQASAEFGICKTFLELTLPYPHTLYVSEINSLRDGTMRLWYSHTDPFGEHRMESFHCKFVNDPETGLVQRVDEIRMSKVNMDPKRLEYLNNALPYFHENPLILAWPAALPDSIGALQLDFNAVRRIVIDPTK